MLTKTSCPGCRTAIGRAENHNCLGRRTSIIHPEKYPRAVFYRSSIHHTSFPGHGSTPTNRNPPITMHPRRAERRTRTDVYVPTPSLAHFQTCGYVPGAQGCRRARGAHTKRIPVLSTLLGTHGQKYSTCVWFLQASTKLLVHDSMGIDPTDGEPAEGVQRMAAVQDPGRCRRRGPKTRQPLQTRRNMQNTAMQIL